MRGVLRLYDNKGLLGLGANILGIKGPKDLMEKVSRLLGCEGGKRLRAELIRATPAIPV
jgi:hypothetical protein